MQLQPEAAAAVWVDASDAIDADAGTVVLHT